MSTHKTWLGKILHGEFDSAFDDLKDWLHEIFKNANHDILNIAITLTELAKQALNSKAVDQFITFTSTNVDNEAAAWLRAKVPVISADLLLIKGVKESTNEDELKATAKAVIDSFGGLTDEQKEVFYSSLAAKLYIEWQKYKAGEKITFGTAVALVEGLFKTE